MGGPAAPGWLQQPPAQVRTEPGYLAEPVAPCGRAGSDLITAATQRVTVPTGQTICYYWPSALAG